MSIAKFRLPIADCIYENGFDNTTSVTNEFRSSRQIDSRQLAIGNALTSRRHFLQAAATGMLGASFLRSSLWSNPTRQQILYVGTYTTGKSEGIYLYRMDETSGELTRLGSTSAVNPSFVTIDRTKRYLYAVNEVGEFGGKPSGAVSAFSIDPANAKLTLLNQQPSLGADPCYVAVNGKGSHMLVANYTGGSVAVLPILRDGRLGSATDLKQHEGSGPKEQQKGAHAHCIMLDAAERHALAADLGSDKVMIYRFDSADGKLVPSSQPSAKLKAGAGPRHLTFHPSGKHVYVINELDSTISGFAYDGVRGTLQIIETISTLPEGFSGVSYCADVHVSRSGKFLYGSNRGHDSIVVFEIDNNTGKLRLVEHVPTGGKWPRNFTIDPTERFLLVANQRTDNVVVFRIDPKTGRLTATGKNAEIPSPVCLKFK